MMKVLIYILFLFLFVSCGKEKKVAYIVNAKLFSECNAMKEVNKGLQEDKTKRKNELDSMQARLDKMKTSSDLESYEKGVMVYRSLERSYQDELYSKQEQATQQVLGQVTKYVEEYGKENGYAFIHGAAGSGNLMYADTKYDITEEVINYVNKRYEDE